MHVSSCDMIDHIIVGTLQTNPSRTKNVKPLFRNKKYIYNNFSINYLWPESSSLQKTNHNVRHLYIMMMLKLQNTIDSFWSAWSIVEQHFLQSLTHQEIGFLLKQQLKSPTMATFFGVCCGFLHAMVWFTNYELDHRLEKYTGSELGNEVCIFCLADSRRKGWQGYRTPKKKKLIPDFN